MTDGLPSVEDLAAAVERDRGGPGASVTVREQSPRAAETLPAGDVLRPALAGRYPHDPYSHQAAALDALDGGENVVVTTSTASGKTEVYAIQILRNLLDTGVLRADGSRTGAGNAASTALCIYPTKALAADQRAALTDLYDEMGMDVRVRRYDGDTPRGDRREIRETADVVLTNPMGVNTYLHDHDRWRRVLGALDLVALDESHTHTGVQGMHVAWILRRLRRVVDEWGGDPDWVLTSATVGNPGEHSETLLGEPVTVVDEDGSPRGRRDLVLWNPPADGGGGDRNRDQDGGNRRAERDGTTGSAGDGYAVDDPPTAPGVEGAVTGRVPASVEAPRVWRRLADAGVRSLLFCPSRKLTEVAVQRALDLDGPVGDAGSATARATAPRLEAYNAGMGKLTRSRREEAFKAGEVAGLATTSALELGIDIGDLDATVLLGYPGQRQSFFQRVGRAGRGTERSMGVLVADHRTLDQYVVDNPDYLLESDVEDAVVDTGNDAVFARHVLCAADEIALDEGDLDAFADADRLRAAVEMWRRVGKLDGHLDGAVHYAGPRRPQTRVDLYGTDGREFDLRLADDVDPAAWGLPADGLDAESVARNRAYRDYHEGAVRLVDGQQFEVVGVDEERPQPVITLAPVDVDYYTRTLTDVNVMDATAETRREVNGFTVAFGTGTVVVHHHAYDQVDVDSNEPKRRMLDTGRPAITLETQLCWVEVPHEIERALVTKYADDGVETGVDPEDADPPQLGYVAGLHAAEHAMIKTAPLELLVDQGDLGGLSTLVLDSHFADPAFDDIGTRVGESLAAVEAALQRRSRTVEGGTASGWFVYDGVEGGLGFSRSIYERFEALAERARDSLADCRCGRTDGCPACTYSENCGNDNAPLLRESAVDVLDLLVGDADPAELTHYLPEDEDEGERRSPALFYA